MGRVCSHFRIPALALVLLLLLFWGRADGNVAVAPQDLEKILERADKLLEEAKGLYEGARSKSSLQDFIAAGFKLEDARIKYLVLQEVGSSDQQKLASDRLRAVNQLTKLIGDGKLVVSPPPAGAAASKGSEAPPPVPPPSPEKVAPAEAGTKDAAGRIAIPDSARQKEAEKLVKDLFKEQYAKKTAHDRKALALLLLDQASKTQSDAAAYWVLCREAQDAAIQAGDATTAVQAVESTSAVFDIDGIATKSAALAAAGKTARTPEEFSSLSHCLTRLVDEMIAADQFDVADKTVSAALLHAKRSNDVPLLARTTIRSKEVAEAKALFQGLKKVRETLARDSESPGANLEMGKFLCYAKGSWDLGLRYLAKGSDATLKNLAEKEIAAPPQAPDRLALAEAWHELSDKEKSPLRKGKLAAHALELYESALPDSSGLVRAKLEKRMAELKAAESKPPPMGRHPGRAGLVAWWKFDEGKGTTVTSSAGSGNGGALTGGVEWTAGRLGGALKFNGSSGFVACKPSNLPAANAAQTISWWHFYTSNPGTPESIITLSDGGPSSSVQPGFKGGQVAVWKYGGNILVAAVPPSTGAWHHYAYVFDGKRHMLYIDGKLESTTSSTEVPPQTATPTKCEFGRWWGGDSYFSGLLDDVRIYSRVLPEAEILGLASE